MRLKALKPLSYPRGRYNTRRLVPGDIFEVPDNKAGRLDAKVLRARRLAEELREPVNLAPPPPAVAAKMAAAVEPRPSTFVEADDLAGLRAEYERVVGRRPFMGWDGATLREKMAAAAS